MKNAALSLLQSRKFWLTTLTICTSIAMYLRHAITADQLANVLTASSAVLVYSIAHEDAGPGSGTSLTATLVVPPPLPSGDVGHLASAQVSADDTQPVVTPVMPPRD